MNAAEAMIAAAEAGVTLGLSDGGSLVITTPDRSALAPEVKTALIDHRDRLAAALKLRVIHRAMGLSEEDVMFVEQALLMGRISEIKIVARPPEGPPA